MERFVAGRRHIAMRMLAFGATLLALAFTTPVAVGGQQVLDVQASAGLGGYVDPEEPTQLFVTVQSPSLFVGSIEISMRSFQTSVPLEVPADGLKELVVDLPAPGAAPTVLVRIVDADGNQVLDRDVRVALNPGFEQVLTGVIGSSSLEASLQQVRSEPLLLPVTPIAIGEFVFDSRLNALDYIVAAPDAIRSLSADQRAGLLAWVEAGGRLVAAPADASALGAAPAPAGRFGAADVSTVGIGELLVVEDPAQVALEDWPQLLRDVPQSVAQFQNVEVGVQSEWNLISAASAGGAAALPQIPWLAVALVVYAVIVGPVNFAVLRRIGRPELAWLTIPLLSLVAVGLFWLNGPRGDRAAVSHASVVVYDPDLPRAQSGLVMVSGTEGQHELAAGTGWSLTPSGAFGRNNVVGSATTTEASSITFDLRSLEAATALGNWSPNGAAPLAAAIAADGNTISVDITNVSEWSFWSWGVVSGFDAAGRSTVLAPGETASTTLRFAGANDPWEPPMARIAVQGGGVPGMRDPWQVVYPLGTHLGATFRDSLDGIYLFGYTDDVALGFTVDGGAVEAGGTSLVVVPLDDALQMRAVSTAELLYAQGADWVEPNGFSTFIGGADAVYLRFSAPAGVTSGRISQGFNFGVDHTFDVYDWIRHEWVPIARDVFDGAEFFTPSGELVVRMTPGEEFADVIPDAIRAEWDT